MIRQAAFEKGQRLLKGALHCHTTRSDGRGAPEEVIRLHKAHGYDFMALTDHNIYNYKNHAPEIAMTIVPGMERDHNLPKGPDTGNHTFHTVVIGPERSAGNGYEQDQRFQGGTPVRDQEAFQPILDDYHQHNNLTIYCHPVWSGTTARDFEKLRGNFAMEVWNTGCVMENDMDSNAAYWDELLLQGIRIFGVATDDGHAMDHHCKGWVMVRAENKVQSILDALKAGAFYSSCGPEIHDFYIDGDKAVLECSPCVSAGFFHGQMPSRLTQSADGQVTRAEAKVPAYCAYLRAVVKDAQGRRAWSNPIYLR